MLTDSLFHLFDLWRKEKGRSTAAFTTSNNQIIYETNDMPLQWNEMSFVLFCCKLCTCSTSTHTQMISTGGSILFEKLYSIATCKLKYKVCSAHQKRHNSSMKREALPHLLSPMASINFWAWWPSLHWATSYMYAM